MFPYRSSRDTKRLGCFPLRHFLDIQQNHSRPLPPRQPTESSRKARVHIGKLTLRHLWKPGLSPAICPRTRLPNPKQVAHRVIHSGDLTPVLPGERQRIPRRFTPNLRPKRPDQSTQQPRFSLPNKTGELPLNLCSCQDQDIHTLRQTIGTPSLGDTILLIPGASALPRGTEPQAESELGVE